MATDSYVPVEDASGAVRNIANVQFVNGNGDTVQMQRTGDYFNGDEYLTDQVGAGGVLTFDFSAPVQLVYIRAIGNVVRATFDGSAPNTSRGAYVGADESQMFPRNTAQVKVYADPGVTVAVWGVRF